MNRLYLVWKRKCRLFCPTFSSQWRGPWCKPDNLRTSHLKQGYKSECWLISDAAPLSTHPVATTVSQLLSFSIVQQHIPLYSQPTLNSPHHDTLSQMVSLSCLPTITLTCILKLFSFGVIFLFPECQVSTTECLRTQGTEPNSVGANLI